MADSRVRDFMFCEMCGTMLSYNNIKYVRCPLCKSKKPVKGLEDFVGNLFPDVAGKKICYTVTAKDIQRELGISSSFDDFEVEKEAKQMDYNAKCKTCQHVGMSYVTMQTRSADEGQTIFYTCPKCGSKQTENS